MGQRTISLNDNVFKKLQKRKPKSESYSEFLDKLLDEKVPKDIQDISNFHGCLKDERENEWDDILTGIYENRKKITERIISLDD